MGTSAAFDSTKQEQKTDQEMEDHKMTPEENVSPFFSIYQKSKNEIKPPKPP